MANQKSLDLERSSSQYAGIADASQTGLDLTGDFTLEAWIKPESLPTDDNYYICGKFNYNGVDQRSYALALQNSSSTNRVAVYISDGGTDDGAAGSALFTYTATAGVWTHLAAVYTASSGTIQVYANGVSIGSEAGNVTSIHNGTADFRIGTNHSGNYFDGLIDEVRIWSDVRTQAEIIANKNTELVGNEANLVGYWKLNNDYLDETSNNNDLTASGSPVFSSVVPFSDTQIQFDSVSTGAGNAPSLTFSHTTGSGSNRILFVGVASNDNSGISGVTYAGNAMTLIETRTDTRAGAPRQYSLYYIVAPTTGANDVVVSAAGTAGLYCAATSYTGASQTGQPDAHNSGTSAGAASISVSNTSVADNCWGAMYARNYSTQVNSGTNFTLRGTAGSYNMGDTNAAVTPAGVISMTANASSGTPEWQAIAATFAPAVAVAATTKSIESDVILFN